MLIHELASGIFHDGVPVVGTVTFYIPGTLTKRTVYAAQATTAEPSPATVPNPATLDGDGRVTAYTDLPIRILVQNTAGTTILDLDPAVDPNITADKVTNDDALQAYFTGVTVSADLIALGISLGGIDGKLKVASGTERYIKSWAADVVNVKNYGATGDGTTDDTAAIIAAIAVVTATGGCLYFPAGIYVISAALTFASFANLMVAGDGPRSILRQSGSSFAVLDMTSCTSVTISDLQLQGGGNASSTGAVGIQWDAGSSDISIKGVRFDGVTTPAAVGFNTGINGLGTDVSISGCRFTRIYGNLTTGAVGNGVLLTSVTRLTVAACDFVLDVNGSGTPTGNIGLALTSCARFKVTDVAVDYAGSFGVKLTSCSYGTVGQAIVQNTTSGAIALGKTGIYVSAGLDVELLGCKSYSNGRHGVALALACNRVRVTGGSFNSNTNSGVYVSDTSTDLSIGGGVTCYGNTDHGIEYVTATASADPHNGGTIGPLYAVHNGKSGVYLQGVSYVALKGVAVKDCSTSSIRTYPAFDITSYVAATVGYGGTGISLESCSARETAATYEHLCAVRCNDGAAWASGATVVSTTATACDFEPQATSGTKAVFIIGGVTNNWNVLRSGNKYLALRESIFAGTPTGNNVLTGDSGTTFLVDVSAGSVTLNLPDLGAASTTDYRNAWRARFLKVGNSTNNLVLQCAGTNLIRIPNGATAASLGCGVKGAAIEIVFYNNIFEVVSATPAAGGNWA